MEPYPSVTDIQALNLISHNQALYVFGGVFNETLVTNQILIFKNETWSNVGNLLSKRVQFSVILIGDIVHIVSGEEQQNNEMCILSNIVSCMEDNTINYKNFKQPILFSPNLDDLCNKNITSSKSNELKELMILSKVAYKEIDNFVNVEKTKHRLDE